MNKPLIVANWKMNPMNLRDALELATAVVRGVRDSAADIVLCPPALYIPELLPTGNVFLGAQDCFWEQQGAFTGEVSPAMLKSFGCSYVILGRSERRAFAGETLSMIHGKVVAALQAQVIPIICVGEHITEDLKIVLEGVNSDQRKHLVLAYEPEWAISTSKNAKPASAENVQKAIVEIKNIAGNDVPVLYGGSTNSGNIRDFIEAGVQGALVGSASLDAKEFVQLVKNAVTR